MKKKKKKKKHKVFTGKHQLYINPNPLGCVQNRIQIGGF